MRRTKICAIMQILVLALTLPLAAMGKVPEGGKKPDVTVVPIASPKLTAATKSNPVADVRTERVAFTKRRKAIPVEGKAAPLKYGLEKGARLQEDGTLELGMTEYTGKMPPNSPKIEYCTPKQKTILGKTGMGMLTYIDGEGYICSDVLFELDTLKMTDIRYQVDSPARHFDSKFEYLLIIERNINLWDVKSMKKLWSRSLPELIQEAPALGKLRGPFYPENMGTVSVLPEQGGVLVSFRPDHRTPGVSMLLGMDGQLRGHWLTDTCFPVVGGVVLAGPGVEPWSVVLEKRRLPEDQVEWRREFQVTEDEIEWLKTARGGVELLEGGELPEGEFYIVASASQKAASRPSAKPPLVSRKNFPLKKFSRTAVYFFDSEGRALDNVSIVGHDHPVGFFVNRKHLLFRPATFKEWIRMELK